MAELNYGEVLISVREIARNCKIEPTKVHRILKRLEACNKIATRSATNSGTGKTIISIDAFGSFETKNATEENKICNSTPETKDEKEKRSKREKAESKDLIKKKGKKNIYGTFENVKLTNEEFESFKAKFPYSHMRYIDDLSLYIASRGDKYKSHYATLLAWNRDKEESSGSFDTDEFFEAALKRSAENIRRRAGAHTKEN